MLLFVFRGGNSRHIRNAQLQFNGVYFLLDLFPILHFRLPHAQIRTYYITILYRILRIKSILLPKTTDAPIKILFYVTIIGLGQFGAVQSLFFA